MSTVSAHNTLVVLGQEDTYGTAQETPTLKLPDMMEYTFGVEKVSAPQKTQTLEPQIKTSQEGRKMPTVTLSGVLTDSHEELLTAAFGNASSPYSISTSDLSSGSAGYSYTIVQANVESSSDLGDGVVATGCRLETLNITKDGQYVSYTATFKAQSIDDMVDLSAYILTSLTDSDTTYPELTPFMWQDVTCSLVDTEAISNLNTFSLDLTNEYVDDDLSFQNSQTRNSLAMCGTTGTLTAEWIYDTVNDAGVYNNILSQTTQSDEIALVNTNYTWTISTEGQYQSYTKPDKEKCLFTGSFNKELLGDGSNTAISIAVA